MIELTCFCGAEKADEVDHLIISGPWMTKRQSAEEAVRRNLLILLNKRMVVILEGTR
jgi:hypothetical protein